MPALSHHNVSGPWLAITHDSGVDGACVQVSLVSTKQSLIAVYYFQHSQQFVFFSCHKLSHNVLKWWTGRVISILIDGKAGRIVSWVWKNWGRNSPGDTIMLCLTLRGEHLFNFSFKIRPPGNDGR